MVFPQTALPITVELYLSSAWVDITSDVYERDAITITRGRSEEGGQVDPGRCLMTLDNRTGKYSPRNPNSAYYGQLMRNTPIRVSVDAGDPSLQLPGTVGASASTPDAASLDLLGDMEIQIEVSHDTWEFSASKTLMSKWNPTGDQRSYALTIGADNTLTFRRTTLGTIASQQTDISTEAVPIPTNGRLAIKVTFDLDDGGGVSRTKFYTSTGIDGTWTQLGDDRTGSTTATFNSTATLQAGDSNNGFDSWDGNIHEFRLLSTIGGTAVANPDFTAQAVGATSFADAAGKTWTVNGAASIINRDRRFYGEVSSWPVLWDTSADDVYVRLEAAGILRRMGQGAAPLESTLRRAIPQSDSLLAYWPMEDGTSARQFNSPMAGVQPMTFRSLDPASIDTMPGSSALPTISSSSNTAIRLNAQVPSNSSGEARVEFVYRTDTAPTTLRTYMRVMTTGSIREWQFQMNDTQSRLIGRDADGAAVFTNDMTWGATEPFGAWWRFTLELTQNGANVDYRIEWFRDGETSLADSGSAAGTFGRIYNLSSPIGGFSTDLDGTGIGHIAVFYSVTAGDDFTDADMGYDAEVAGTRMERLRDEEGIDLILHGELTDQEALGPQRPNDLLTILQECADADGGILYEGRRSLTLEYRDRNTLYNQTARLTLNCQGNEGLVSPLEPVDDDQHVRNDITVTRTDGSEGHAVLESGSLSVLEPPNGVGRYRDSLTLNLYDDDQAIQAANWFLHLGTWDETRYPRVSVLLQKSSAAKVAQAMAVDIGDRIQLTSPPSWLPPGTIDLLVQGYTELIHQYRWEFEYNCTPARPWNVAYATDSFSRGAATDSDLVTAVNSSATSLTVDSVPRWLTSTSYASEFPFTVEMGGETMSVTALTSAQLDAFGRTEASTWGSADIGGAWTSAGGVASNFSVSGGFGTHTLTTTNVSRRSSLTSPSADFDVQVDVSISALPTGGSMFGGIMARVVDGDNLYMGRLEFTTSNTLILAIRERTAGVEATLGSTFTAALTIASNTDYRIRFQGDGTTLRAKVWVPSVGEPGVWHVSTTDSTLTAAGLIGCRSILASGNTNVNPAITYDNYEMLNPQTFTVTRSSNGVSKSHSAGADIQLRDTVAVAF